MFWEQHIKTHVLRLVQGDITDQHTDAIVNAANSSLVLGGGVAGAIRQKGGPQIQKECDAIGGTPTGSAVITSGGQLPATYVMHAVGPIWGNQSDEVSQVLLASAVKSCLELCMQYKLHSITFPALSTGIFGFPKDIAAKIMYQTIRTFLSNYSSPIHIQICLYNQIDYDIFLKIFQSFSN
jgi:O-acetyl-ADP-ribose deacetylase (regulator of RNase III)